MELAAIENEDTLVKFKMPAVKEDVTIFPVIICCELRKFVSIELVKI